MHIRILRHTFTAAMIVYRSIQCYGCHRQLIIIGSPGLGASVGFLKASQRSCLTDFKLRRSNRLRILTELCPGNDITFGSAQSLDEPGVVRREGGRLVICSQSQGSAAQQEHHLGRSPRAPQPRVGLAAGHPGRPQECPDPLQHRPHARRTAFARWTPETWHGRTHVNSGGIAHIPNRQQCMTGQ